jgi:hypothetical protein
VPRTSRHRTRTSSQSGYYTVLLNGGIWDGPITNTVLRTCICDDSIGRPVEDSTFNSEQWKTGLTLNGSMFSEPNKFNGNVFSISYYDYPILPDPAGCDTSSLPVDMGWFLRTVARTNPSRPIVTPPQLIQDFIELPAMVKNIGSILTKPKRLLSDTEVSNQYLAAQFGWIPLVNDLRQLLDLQSAVLKRTAEIEKLYTGRGLRRRVQLGHDTQDGVAQYSKIILGGAVLRYSYDVHVVRKQWSTIRWWASTPPPGVAGHIDMNKKVRRIVLGLTPEGLMKGAWDVIPWTWLLGWFTNVGDYMLVYSNTVPAHHTSACLMNEKVVTYMPRPVTTDAATRCSIVMDKPAMWSHKIRTLSGALTPGFYLPFVDKYRLSILSALSVQRYKR